VETKAIQQERLSSRPLSYTTLDQSGKKVLENPDNLVTVTYSGDLPVEPYFDEDASPSFALSEPATDVISLGPHTVFPEGAEIFIPWFGDPTESGLTVYGFDGEEWIPIIDSNGNDLTEGSWVIPGWNGGLSWELVDNGNPSGIKIRVRHFSSFVAASGGTQTGNAAMSAADTSSGCFISTMME